MTALQYLTTEPSVIIIYYQDEYEIEAHTYNYNFYLKINTFQFHYKDQSLDSA
jgi:hypothetical protein